MIVMNSMILVLILFILYLFCIHPGSRPIPAEMQKNYAHRGLYGGEIPENSLAAFTAAVDAGYGIELDVHLLKDGGLGIFHDSSLKRMASGKGRIEDLKTGQLKNYKLAKSQETIPTLQEVLQMVGGKVPLIIELKTVDGNHEPL